LNTGNYNNVKVDITISSSVECNTPDDIKDTSSKLFKMAKMLVEKDIAELKIEKGVK
jgi:hypothetical protein